VGKFDVIERLQCNVIFAGPDPPGHPSRRRTSGPQLPKQVQYKNHGAEAFQIGTESS
jgi:hypothetical protein